MTGETSKTAATTDQAKREKRTITEIRGSKKTGEKMVYMSVGGFNIQGRTAVHPGH